MNRLDFHSVATLLQKHLIETADMTQIVFISTLFSCFVNDSDFSFDEGLCCKWMKGQAKISPKIVSYYQNPKHQKEMYADMEKEVFLMISDVGALITDLYELLISDVSVSELKRKQLLSYFDDNDTSKAAVFASEILLFAISRPFVKANLKTTEISPTIEDVIITTTVPKPVKTYIDREDTLTTIAALLEEHNTLFIHGIPGIGKSVKALELEEKAIKEACGKGTTRIFNLSSMYLDAGSYCTKPFKFEKALMYIKKATNILVETQTQYSLNGIYTMTTYAKLLYHQGKFSEASRIFTSC